MNFDKAFELIIGHEGGFTDDKRDPGNWTGGKVGVGTLKGTKYGIASNSYPSLDIKNITIDQAKAIYKRDYWDRVKADLLPDDLRLHVFDMAVNGGISRAVKLLQKSVGVSEDGSLGPLTLSAVNKANPFKLVLDYNANRILFYTSLSTFSTYGKGWVNRVARNMKL